MLTQSRLGLHSPTRIFGETVPHGIEILELAADDLEDGQTWEDEIPLTLKRHQWSILFTIAMAQAARMRDAADNAMADARKGDVVAMLVMPHLHESTSEMIRITQELGRIVAPKMMQEVDADLGVEEPSEE